MLWWSLIVIAISATVGVVRAVRLASAARRTMLGWMARIDHHHEGVSSHVIQSRLSGDCGLWVAGDSQGGLGVSFAIALRPGQAIPSITKARLTFHTDRKAHISGPADPYLLGEDRLLLSYANRETLPKLIEALADSEQYFEVWASSSAWRFDKYRRFESVSFRGPARALLADAEKGVAAARAALELADAQQAEAERAEAERQMTARGGHTIH